MLTEEILNPFIKGLIISLSLIISIGPQNAFVIRYGLARKFVIPVILTCIFGDLVLIAIGVFGTAKIFEEYRYAALIGSIAGIIFLLYFSFSCFRNALNIHKGLEVTSSIAGNLKTVILQGLAFTFLNPIALIDTILLIGGVSSQYSQKPQLIAYFLGSLAGSIIWFISIGLFSAALYPIFQKPIAWKILDLCTGCLMIIIAYFLGKHIYLEYC